MKIVPDTSVVVDGRVSERVRDGSYADATVVIPEAVVAELESQANDGIETGWEGLEELRTLADLAADGEIEIEYAGDRPDADEIGAASEGEIDALIREFADRHGATFVTSDVVQSRVAQAKGVDVEYLSPKTRSIDRLSIEDHFDDDTMSLHLKAGEVPMAKRGRLGEMRYEAVTDDPLGDDRIEEVAREIEAAGKESDDGFVELSRPGMTIVQYRNYRIAAARPPIAKTDIDDYEKAGDLKERLLERQRGVLISGAPGAGKSTFAQAAAEFIADDDYVVKTMEKPRDLQVGGGITQYTELDGSMANTADSLLMVRPDYTIYDEVRKSSDFEVFADMRLAGVGMIGVVHATRAIDSLQRLVGRVELGMIPQVVDTVVYIEAGQVETVYDVTTEVKVPAGLTEEDLARPVILIRDFETGEPAYEIYSFNRQVVTVPLDETEDDDRGVDRIARGEIEREIESIAHGHVDVEITGPSTATVYVTDDDIPSVIGKGGGRIQEIERRLGMDLDVRTHDERPGGRGGGGGGTATTDAGQIVDPEIGSRHVILPIEGHTGETVEIRADGEYLFTATVGRGGDVQVSRGSAIADELERAVDRNARIGVVPN
ncbi:ATPase [Halobacteriales archaeon SW_7_68_16]|nr:MAG: ATPase [Halobacteriales archaeon SW_7_68_16]